MNKNVITLTGFMGSGKTYLSKILARELGFAVVDSDAEVEKRAGMCISRIIADNGEHYFRKMETDVLRDILSRDFTVLSAGGGAALKNGELLKEGSAVVFLDTPFDKCYQRIKDDKNRPLVYGKSREEAEALYNARYPLYIQNCHFAVKHDDAAETVKKIKEFLQNN